MSTQMNADLLFWPPSTEKNENTILAGGTQSVAVQHFSSQGEFGYKMSSLHMVKRSELFPSAHYLSI